MARKWRQEGDYYIKGNAEQLPPHVVDQMVREQDFVGYEEDLTPTPGPREMTLPLMELDVPWKERTIPGLDFAVTDEGVYSQAPGLSAKLAPPEERKPSYEDLRAKAFLNASPGELRRYAAAQQLREMGGKQGRREGGKATAKRRRRAGRKKDALIEAMRENLQQSVDPLLE